MCWRFSRKMASFSFGISDLSLNKNPLFYFLALCSDFEPSKFHIAKQPTNCRVTRHLQAKISSNWHWVHYSELIGLFTSCPLKGHRHQLSCNTTLVIEVITACRAFLRGNYQFAKSAVLAITAGIPIPTALQGWVFNSHCSTVPNSGLLIFT